MTTSMSDNREQFQPRNIVNEDEFSTLYASHARQIYTFIRTLVPQQADAEDAFQDVSAVLWQKFNQYQRGTNFIGWAIQISKYCVLHLRDYRRRSAYVASNEFIDVISKDHTDLQESFELQFRALADCYSRLSAVDQNLVDQRYQTGTTVKDLAEQLGRPLRTVYRMFERIHIALLDCIERKIGKEEVL